MLHAEALHLGLSTTTILLRFVSFLVNSEILNIILENRLGINEVCLYAGIPK